MKKKVGSIKMPEIQKVLAQTPEESKNFVSKSMEISHQIFLALQERGVNQKYLADALGKSEPEISKWLSGTHNFTIKTLAAIETALGREVIVTPNKIKSNIFRYTTVVYRASVNETMVLASASGKVHTGIISTSHESLVA